MGFHFQKWTWFYLLACLSTIGSGRDQLPGSERIFLEFQMKRSSPVYNILPLACLCVSCTVMTSSNGNILRVTGPLCGEFTSHRCIWNFPIALKFERHISSIVADVPLKFQRGEINYIANPAASILHEILKDALSDIETGPRTSATLVNNNIR